MGDMTESCGGYEIDYDPYEESMESGVWIQRDGTGISVTKMTTTHLQAAIRFVERKAQMATFSNQSEMWHQWKEMFEAELYHRPTIKAQPKIAKAPAGPARGKSVEMICHCGCEYTTRNADLKRGWGLSCGKRCAAIRRDFGRPAGKQKNK